MAQDSKVNKETVIEPTKPAENKDASGEDTLVQEDQTLDSSAGSGGNDTGGQSPQKPPLFKRFLGFSNLYFAIFLLLLLLAAGAIYASVKLNKSNNPQPNKAGSLTSQQISQLKGNTTLVGSSQQTLDIQGNSIFESSVLMRNDLDVAGSIKVGGTLSLPAITVGGASTFGQIQVNQTLLVGGNTTLQGQLTVQKGLSVAGTTSFGTLSASQLNVGSLQLTGDLTISHHIRVNGGTPSRSFGPALGGGGTASINGTDTAGTVTISTGGGPPAGCFVTVNFTHAFASTPHVVISPSDSSAGTIAYYTNRSTTGFSVCDASTPAAGATYVFDYIVLD